MKKDVLDIRPTQLVLGMREVDDKIKLIKSFGKKKLDSYVDEHVVPGVVGNGGHFYAIDHHHFLSAAFQTGIKEVHVKVLEDLSSLNEAEFWDHLKSKQWLYLLDQYGDGPREPRHLPLDIRTLADDVYRSLAWELRAAGVIEKNQAPFSEFKWAALLRENLEVDLHVEKYKAVVPLVLTLAKKLIAEGKAPN